MSLGYAGRITPRSYMTQEGPQSFGIGKWEFSTPGTSGKSGIPWDLRTPEKAFRIQEPSESHGKSSFWGDPREKQDCFEKSTFFRAKLTFPRKPLQEFKSLLKFSKLAVHFSMGIPDEISWELGLGISNFEKLGVGIDFHGTQP